MNKRGIFNPVEITIYILSVIIVATFIAFAIFSFIDEEISTTHLEVFILEKKLVNSESCLAYKEDSKLNLGVIDLEKLSNQRLSNCFTKEGFGYIIKILELDGNVVKIASNLNRRQEAYLPICKKVKRHECLTRRNFVQYNEEGKIKTGYINIEVINFVG